MTPAPGAPAAQASSAQAKAPRGRYAPLRRLNRPAAPADSSFVKGWLATLPRGEGRTPFAVLLHACNQAAKPFGVSVSPQRLGRELTLAGITVTKTPSGDRFAVGLEAPLAMYASYVEALLVSRDERLADVHSSDADAIAAALTPQQLVELKELVPGLNQVLVQPLGVLDPSRQLAGGGVLQPPLGQQPLHEVGLNDRQVREPQLLRQVGGMAVGDGQGLLSGQHGAGSAMAPEGPVFAHEAPGLGPGQVPVQPAVDGWYDDAVEGRTFTGAGLVAPVGAERHEPVSPASPQNGVVQEA